MCWPTTRFVCYVCIVLCACRTLQGRRDNEDRSTPAKRQQADTRERRQPRNERNNERSGDRPQAAARNGRSSGSGRGSRDSS
jgi:hypothetical protein